MKIKQQKYYYLKVVEKQIPRFSKIKLGDYLIDCDIFANQISQQMQKINMDEEVFVSDYQDNLRASFFNEKIDEQNLSLAEQIFQLDINSGKNLISLIFSLLDQNVHVKNCIQKQKQIQVFQNPNYTFDQFMKFRSYEKQKNHEIFYVNHEKIKAQRSVLKTLIKQIAKNIMAGKSLMNQSLPVDVFEAYSQLDRIAHQFSFLPQIMNKIKDKNNQLEVLKAITSFLITAVLYTTGQEKPFNPLLGETKQYVLNGVEISIEQISHHPPIAYFYIKAPNFLHYGSHNIEVNHSTNSLVVYQIDQQFFEINNIKYHLYWPSSKLINTLMGQRKQLITKQGYICDPQNDIVCQINYKKDSENFTENNLSDEIKGQILKLRPGLVAKRMKKNSFDFKDSDVLEVLSELKGNYLERINFDNQVYFDYLQENCCKLEQVVNPIPSDSIFRKDIICLKLGDLEGSQNQKTYYEVEERQFQKLRKRY